MSVELVKKIEELGSGVESFKAQQGAEVKALKDRTDELEARLNTPVFTGGGRDEKAETWEDSDGREVKILTGKQRLNHSGEPHLVGELIQGLMSGKMRPAVKAQVIGTDASGGYLLDVAARNGFIDLARHASVVAQAGAGTIVLETGEYEGKLLKLTGSDPLVSWVGEKQEIPEGDVTFGLVSYRLRKSATLLEISHEFMETVNGAALIEQVVRAAMAAEMDRVALMGSGAGVEPVGLSNTAGIGAITSVGDITHDDVLNGIKTVRVANHTPTAGIWSPATDYELSILKAVADGQYLTPPAAYTALPKYLTNKATDALAFVGDFSKLYWVVDQKGIRVEIGTAASSFKRDSVFLRVIMPMDVIVTDATAFCKLSGLS